MKIGIIVDGQAELHAISEITKRIALPHSQILSAIYADMQPKATPQQIARSALAKCHILLAKSVDKIVILIDREDRHDCPSQFSSAVEAAFNKLGVEVASVVIKDRQFENWLIADPVGLAKGMTARVHVTPAFIRQVSPNRADAVRKPCKLLDTICVREEYHKRRDAISIARALNADRLAGNSRSFRRFLRVLEFPAYSTQSRNPVK